MNPGEHRSAFVGLPPSCNFGETSRRDKTSNIQHPMSFPLSPEASSPQPSPPLGEERESESRSSMRFMGSTRATGFGEFCPPLRGGEGDAIKRWEKDLGGEISPITSFFSEIYFGNRYRRRFGSVTGFFKPAPSHKIRHITQKRDVTSSPVF